MGPSRSRQFASGPLSSKADLKPGDGVEAAREMDAFFTLPEIYAYSDAALNGDRSPLARAHWDGTVALIEVRYETALTTWHQRMLFIGFSDAIHADFTIGIDDDLFVAEKGTGTQLFEWRTNHPVGDTAAAEEKASLRDEAVRANPSSVRQRLSELVNGRWLHYSRLRSFSTQSTALPQPGVIGETAQGR